MRGPILKIASMRIATTVADAMPSRIAPLTLRMSSTAMRKTPNTKTSVGQPLRLPPMPSSLGTEPGDVGRRAKPASMTPMKAMNRPMPTEMATLSGAGIARKTALRNPVRTRTRMMMPSRTTRPMRSAKVMPSAAWVKTMPAMRPLMPRPAASAIGKFATSPMRIDMTPAMTAVPTATSSLLCSRSATPPIIRPEPSVAPERMIGLRTTM